MCQKCVENWSVPTLLCSVVCAKPSAEFPIGPTHIPFFSLPRNKARPPRPGIHIGFAVGSEFAQKYGPIVFFCPGRYLFKILDDSLFLGGCTFPCFSEPRFTPRYPLGALVRELKRIVVMDGDDDIVIIWQLQESELTDVVPARRTRRP